MRTTFYERTPGFNVTDFVRNEEVRELGERILEGSGFSGPVNIDMRIRADDGTVQLIEVNPRFWDRIVHSLIDEINFVDVGIQAAAGPSKGVVSRAGPNPWPSSLVRPVDPSALSSLARTTWIQVRYLTFTKFLLAYAKVRERLGRD
jgi:predicted ATP-grasp superfamily ATP-dependent carboligase